MSYESVKLKELVNLMAGVPVSRAKKIASDDIPIRARILTPAAMSAFGINSELIQVETVSNVKQDLFTRKGDVIVKTSTPYDCVYIEESDSNILVTSFALILRASTRQQVNMRYLAAYFGLTQTKLQLQNISKGETVRLIKKRDLAEFDIPVPSLAEQTKLSMIYEKVCHQMAICRSIEAKSNLLLQCAAENTIASK